MTDISVRNSFNEKNVHVSQISEFASLYREYQSFKESSSKSDLSNSPVLKEIELAFISQLISAADKEGKKEEIETLKARESELKNELNQIKTNRSNVLYYQPVFIKQPSSPDNNGESDISGKPEIEAHGENKTTPNPCNEVSAIGEISLQTESKADTATPIDELLLKYGTDENAKRIINAFCDYDIKPAHQLEYILSESKDIDSGEISQNAADAVEILAKGNVKLVNIPQMLEEFSTDDEHLKPVVDLSLCNQTVEFKNQGLDDIDALRFTALLNDNFVNKDEIKSSMLKMHNADIPSDYIVKIMNSLTVETENIKETVKKSVTEIMDTLAKQNTDYAEDAVLKLIDNTLSVKNEAEKEAAKEAVGNIFDTYALQNPDEAKSELLNIIDGLNIKYTHKKRISPLALKSVVTFKKSLSKNRGNEKIDKNNPINNLGKKILKLGRDVMIMKDDEIINYITPDESKTVYEAKKEYEELVSRIENDMLLDFVSRYKDENGEIDSKYIRVISILRNNGIIYDNLFEMNDFCLEDGCISDEKLSAIKRLKESGALCSDILGIINTCSRLPDGSCSEEDIANACDLTASVLGGSEVAALIPEVRGSEDMKNFFVNISSSVKDDKKYILDLLPLIKDDTGAFDENAADILYLMAQNLPLMPDDMLSARELSEKAQELFRNAKKDEHCSLDDESANICSKMLENGNSLTAIIEALTMCKDNNGKTDDKLCEILCDMINQKADMNELRKMINFCKFPNGEIDCSCADIIITLFNADYDKSKIMEFASKKL